MPSEASSTLGRATIVLDLPSLMDPGFLFDVALAVAPTDYQLTVSELDYSNLLTEVNGEVWESSSEFFHSVKEWIEKDERSLAASVPASSTLGSLDSAALFLKQLKDQHIVRLIDKDRAIDGQLYFFPVPGDREGITEAVAYEQGLDPTTVSGLGFSIRGKGIEIYGSSTKDLAATESLRKRQLDRLESLSRVPLRLQRPARSHETFLRMNIVDSWKNIMGPIIVDGALVCTREEGFLRWLGESEANATDVIDFAEISDLRKTLMEMRTDISVREALNIVENAETYAKVLGMFSRLREASDIRRDAVGLLMGPLVGSAGYSLKVAGFIYRLLRFIRRR